MLVRQLVSIGLCMSLFFVSGCDDLSKLKDVKSLAIAGVTFKKNFVEVNQENEENKNVPFLNIDFKEGLKFAPIDASAKTYYNSVLDQILDIFQSFGIKVTLAESFKTNETLKKLNHTPDSIFTGDYSPSPFASGEGGQSIELIKQLTNELQVDAVAFVKLYVVKKKGKGLLGSETEKLGLKSTYYIVDKMGQVVMSRGFTVFSKDQIRFIKSDHFEIDVQNEQSFQVLMDRFVAELKQTLAQGYK